MIDPTATAGPASPPGPQDRNPAATPNVAALLLLVHRLVDIGRQLMARLGQPETSPAPMILALRFGTDKVPLILARIARALHRLAGLEQRLRDRAATGQDLQRRPLHMPAPPADGGQRNPPGRRPDLQEPEEVTLTQADLDRILLDARRHPISAVLVDICIDLGLRAGTVDAKTFLQLSTSILNFGGGLRRWESAILRNARLTEHLIRRQAKAKREAERSARQAPPRRQPPPSAPDAQPASLEAQRPAPEMMPPRMPDMVASALGPP